MISTGAQNDLEKATELARAMVSQFGMSDAVGPLSLGRADAERLDAGLGPEGERTHVGADRQGGPAAPGRGARSAPRRSSNDHRELLNQLSALLIATEVIDGDELKAYVEGHEADPRPRDDPADPAARARDDRETVPAEPTAVARAVSIPPAPPMPATD